MKSFGRLLPLFLLLHPLHSQTEFSQDNATQILKTLSVDIGPRPMGSPAERQAMQYAIGKFREYGCDTAYIMEMPYSTNVNTTSGIAIGVKRGATQRIILLGGHIDSAGPEIPGADDDGSGSATLIEAARVLCNRSMQSTLVFCCWGGEEQGLEGSKYFVEHFADLDSVVMMLQVDMANGLGMIDLDPDTHGASAPQWLVEAGYEEFYKLGYHNLDYATHFYSLNYAQRQGAGSDHESFLHKGIAAIDFTTDVTKPIHTPRDNFENFDARGLKRTGDVIIRLVERFDGGVPARGTQQYWLYVIGETPFFISLTMVRLFASVAIAFTILAFIAVRKRREPPDAPERIRWSGIRVALFSLIIVVCGWFSSDVIAIARGIRHPWMTTIPWYYLLAAIAMSIGVWISLRLSGTLRLSRCPYVYFRRAAIILVVYLLAFGLVNVKLIVEPAAALVLISLAMLSRNPFIKFLLVLISPWWMLRIIFSEWSPLFFRGAAMGLPGDIGAWLAFNGIMLLFLTLYILPFSYAGMAVLRDSPRLNIAAIRIKSGGILAAMIVAFVTLSGYLLSQPVYDRLWYRDLHLDESYDMTKRTKEISVKSGEYLRNLKIAHGGTDTLIDARVTSAVIAPRESFDTTWVRVQRSEEKSQSGDTTTFNLELLLSTRYRPYTVSVNYYAGKDKLKSFDTKWQFRNDWGLRSIEFYSFPDSILKIPVKFQITGDDSVKERIEVTFDRLAYPMTVERELTYVIPRTRYSASYVYRK
ncbi:MAG TPA: M28 family peptidase [Bacteroidota bacterium]|jgi:hypothetical protein|nr:M28 family peptidase [Bacteroidota bacterium]